MKINMASRKAYLDYVKEWYQTAIDGEFPMSYRAWCCSSENDKFFEDCDKLELDDAEVEFQRLKAQNLESATLAIEKFLFI